MKKAQAQQPAGNIMPLPVTAAPVAPEHSLWEKAREAKVVLLPQNLVLPRLMKAGVRELRVRALYDNDSLALRLEWPDAHKDVELGTVMQYRDGLAVQFPVNPSGAAPSFMMGQPGNGVVIYHWKSDWQFNLHHDVDEAYPNMYGEWYPQSGVAAGEIPEAADYLKKGVPAYLTAAAAGNSLANPLVQQQIGPVQKMRAEGFGTLEPDSTQDAEGGGVWSSRKWEIVIKVPRKQAGFTFTKGMTVPFAFAAWDGSRSERNGQKSYAPWKNLSLA